MKMRELREKLDDLICSAKNSFAHMLVPPPEVAQAQALVENLTYVDVEPPPEAHAWVHEINLKLLAVHSEKLAGEQGIELGLKLVDFALWWDKEIG